MQEIVFKPLENASILIVGDIILDQYIYGETNRISPEAPVPVVRVKEMEERPGGAANVAVNVSSLGVKVRLLGVTGNDDASERLEKILKDKNVECHFIRQDGFPTITKRRVLSQHQQLIRLDYENEILAAKVDNLVESYSGLIDSISIIILSDYAKGSLVQVQELIKIARDKSIPVLVDPKSKDFSCYKHATILTPNQKELEMVVGDCSTTELLIEKGISLCRSLQFESLLVTRGEDGMVLLRHDQTPLHLHAETQEVYDVTGAGDTVIAVLATAIACGYKIEQATALANTAAGIVVGKLGAANVSANELNNKVNNKSGASGIVDENSIMEVINQARQNKGKIIMTNGCFDILHAGHISYLSKARELGDVLVVAVNDDASVNRLKGGSRPINELQNRMTVLNALSCVDLVIPFSEEKKEKLVSLIQPDVLVKGGDYEENQIAGVSQVKNAGGKVVVLPYEEGHSTSSILEKIKD